MLLYFFFPLFPLSLPFFLLLPAFSFMSFPFFTLYFVSSDFFLLLLTYASSLLLLTFYLSLSTFFSVPSSLSLFSTISFVSFSNFSISRYHHFSSPVSSLHFYSLLALCYPHPPLLKVRKLLGYCPLVSAKEEPSCVLHDRGLSAVVALGLFAVESKLQVLIFNLTRHA